MTPVFSRATGKRITENASNQSIGRPNRFKMSKARVLKRRLRGKAKPKGKTILLPKIRPWKKLVMYAVSKIDMEKTPNGAPETKSRLRPPIKAQVNPSSQPRKIVQPITKIKTKSG